MREIIANAINILKKSKSASDIVPVLERLNKEGKIVFGEPWGNRKAQHTPITNKITLEPEYRDKDIEVIAITLAHEGQHAVDRCLLCMTPLSRETRAFEAEAKIWPEIVNRKEYYHWRQEEIIQAYESGTLREYVKERYATGILGRLLYSF